MARRHNGSHTGTNREELNGENEETPPARREENTPEKPNEVEASGLPERAQSAGSRCLMSLVNSAQTWTGDSERQQDVGPTAKSRSGTEVTVTERKVTLEG